MSDKEETRTLIRGMIARFNRDAKPLIDSGRFKIAARDVGQILAILNPYRIRIQELPSGINYLVSLELIYKSLVNGKKPLSNLMDEYAAYSAQAQMSRPD